MLKIITNQSGTKGFIVDNTFITDPYFSTCLMMEVDPIEYYGLTKDQLTQFEHLKPKPKEPEPSYEELVQKLKGKKFFIVRWSGDSCSHKKLFDNKCACHTSNRVDDPIKFFNEYCYGDDVVKDLNELEVYEKYQVDEMMQDIEIMRVE